MMAFLDGRVSTDMLAIRKAYRAGTLDDDRIRCRDCRNYINDWHRCRHPVGGTDPEILQGCV